MDWLWWGAFGSPNSSNSVPDSDVFAGTGVLGRVLLCLVRRLNRSNNSSVSVLQSLCVSGGGYAFTEFP